MKLTIEHIKEVFTKKMTSSGIIAYYIYRKIGKINKYNIDSNNIKNQILGEFSNNNNDPNINDNLPSNYIIEYFDKKKLGHIILI